MSVTAGIILVEKYNEFFKTPFEWDTLPSIGDNIKLEAEDGCFRVVAILHALRKLNNYSYMQTIEIYVESCDPPWRKKE